MLSRILPREEWGRLAGTELGAHWALLDPAWAEVLVVEDNSQIVGCWALLNVWHLEGVWIAPEYRQGVSVARRLWIGMRRLMGEKGARTAVTAAITPEVAQILAGRATALPGQAYVVNMGETTCQRQSSAA